MKKSILYFFILVFAIVAVAKAQTKVSGIVVDKSNQPIPYANVVFKNSNVGIVTNEDGRFYIESPQTYTVLVITSAGFSDKEVTLEKAVNYNFKIVLKEMQELNEVVVFTVDKVVTNSKIRYKFVVKNLLPNCLLRYTNHKHKKQGVLIYG